MKNSLKYALTVALIAVQVGGLALVLFTSQARTNELLVERFAEHQGRVAESIADEAVQFTNPAKDLVQWVISVDDDLVGASLVSSLLAHLHLHPQIAGVFVGRADGSFYYLSRTDVVEDGFRLKVIEVDGSERTTELVFLDAEGSEVAREFDPEDTYDPRLRPWYREAVVADQLIWTEPYIFFTSGAPGITVAGHEDNGRVVGVDIELEALSQLIASEARREDSAVFLVDRSGTTLAASTPSVGSVVADLVPVGEVEQPLIRSAYAALIASGDTGDLIQVRAEHDQRPHQATFVSVGTELPWTIGIVADDESFLGDLRANQEGNLKWSLVIGLVAAAIAIPLIFGFARPLGRLHHQARTDPVTGLANRRGLTALGTTFLTADSPTVVVMIDVDHFKAANDTYGHAVGDETLRAVAQRLSGALRDGDVVGRWGGDEFLVFLPDTTLETGAVLAERLRSSLAQDPIQTGAGALSLSGSFGVAMSTAGVGLDDVIQLADEALLEAKALGKNNVQLYTEAMSLQV